MKKIYVFIFTTIVLSIFSSCSIQQMAYNAIAPLPEVQYKAETKSKKNADANPILAFTGESDVQLVADAFPVLLKGIEMLYFNNKKHRGIAVMAGQLYIMYANAFVERPASQLSDDFYDEKYAGLMRAKKFYLRGSEYALQALEEEYSGFLKAVFDENEEIAMSAIKRLRIHNVETIYYGASGILAAFALEPMDPDILEQVSGARLMLERATELRPDYNDGALWEVLTSFYGAAPEYLGGGMDKAEYAYKNALEYSRGESPSTYVTYAKTFCVPAQDGKAFENALKKALSIDPDARPETRLMTILSQNDARWLLEHKSEFIYE